LGELGFPGNSHDSIIFQSTTLWSKITAGQAIPDIGKDVEGVKIPPLILGDSAFPFQSWLMKPNTSAVLTPPPPPPPPLSLFFFFFFSPYKYK